MIWDPLPESVERPLTPAVPGPLPEVVSVRGPAVGANATGRRQTAAVQVDAATRLDRAYPGSTSCGTRN